MPLGLFLNPNFTVEEAMEIHIRERNKWKSRMDDEDHEHEERLAEAKEAGAAEIFMGIVEDLQRGDGSKMCEMRARCNLSSAILSLTELHCTLQSVNMMFMIL